jgi:fatty acid CoA ligase FadD9
MERLPVSAPSERANDALLEGALERSALLLERDAELRRLVPWPDALEKIRAARTSIASVEAACELYAGRPALGRRAREAAGGAMRPLPAFSTITYAELWARVGALASGLVQAGLARTGAFVGISGFGSPDWVVADLACLYLSAVSVPLQTAILPSDLARIVRETELSCIVCSAEQLGRLLPLLPECPSVRGLVVMDLDDDDRSGLDAFAEAKASVGEDRPRVEVRTIREIEDLGEGEGGVLSPVLPSERGEADPLMTLMYTSGSTGTPKGAMFPESLWRRHVQARSFGKNLTDVPYVSLCPLPLNHAAGRFQVTSSIVRGGLTHFAFASDMSSFFEDARLARPTSLFLVPRMAGVIHQEMLVEIARGKREEEVLHAMRKTTLGDRLLLITMGSAPTPLEVRSFLKRAFDVPVFDGYGSTEAGPLTYEEHVERDAVTRIKLVDVPELGYTTGDEPFPRGELRVMTTYAVPGYYKNEQATAELFDEDGFLITGDIVQQRGEDRLVWVDRAKNVLKLAQGEFVATSRLEALFATGSPFLRQVFLYGSGVRSYVLAVIVPDLEAASSALREQGILPDEKGLKDLCRDEINRIAMREQLRAYEVPRDFFVEREPFTKENGLLTESEKPARSKLRARYGPVLEELYESIEAAQRAAIESLDRMPGGVRQKATQAIEAVLGVGAMDLARTGQSFIQLGGDSMAAGRLSSILKETLGVDVPAGFVLDPTVPVRAIVDRVAEGGTRPSVTFEQIHGVRARVARASDLTVDRFLSADELSASRAPAGDLPPDARVTLLTGANGFLGRFLTLELLSRLPARGGKLYALVRAPNDELAKGRLHASFEGADPALREELAARDHGRLTVLAGDLMKPKLGLPDATYERLAREVDSVLHNGALVNHALGYADLFEPNVLGTAEIVRFALRTRIKALAYVSTVGALSGLPRADTIREDEDIRALLPERAVEAGYAAGYSTSKWASEVLLRDANDRLGVPVRVFRPSGIMAHTRFRGQINAPDFFTRLCAGLVYTGIAPSSFYEGAGGHYDGLPVDAVARSIAALSLASLRDTASATYHVVNPYRDDGASLDRIVDWVVSAGYPLERMDDYAAWYRAFRDLLGRLADPLRQRSPLPIVELWARPAPASAPGFDASLLLARLRSLSRPGEDLAALPHVTEPFIHKYVADMVALGLLGCPLAGAAE